MKNNLKIILTITLLIGLFGSFAYVTSQNHPNSDDKPKKIAIISGIHSREHQSRQVALETVKKYNKCQVDVYDVTSNPKLNGNFQQSRDNGELLINKELVDHFKNKDYDVILVYHNHDPNYYKMNGLWLATPIPDKDSNKLGNQVANDLKITNFEWTGVTKATSAKRVNIPLTQLGFKVITVEFDQTYTLETNTKQSLALLDSILKFI
jgi:hypothetical protein